MATNAAVKIHAPLSVGDRMRSVRNERQLTQDAVAKGAETFRVRAGADKAINRANIATWESNRTKPDFESVMHIARFLKVSPAYLAFGLDAPVTGAQAPVSDTSELRFLNEIEFGDTVKKRSNVRQWGVPADLIEVPDSLIDKTFVMRVNTDSVSPEYNEGDRVYVDGSINRPVGGGVYAYWDGVGATFGKLQMVPGKTPMVKIAGNGIDLDPMPLNALTIIGKVRGRFSIH